MTRTARSPQIGRAVTSPRLGQDGRDSEETPVTARPRLGRVGAVTKGLAGPRLGREESPPATRPRELRLERGRRPRLAESPGPAAGAQAGVGAEGSRQQRRRRGPAPVSCGPGPCRAVAVASLAASLASGETARGETASGDGSVTAPWTAPARQWGPTLLARYAGLQAIRRVGGGRGMRTASKCWLASTCGTLPPCGSLPLGRNHPSMVWRWPQRHSGRMPGQSRSGSAAGFCCSGNFCQLAAVLSRWPCRVDGFQEGGEKGGGGAPPSVCCSFCCVFGECEEKRTVGKSITLDLIGP